MSLSEPAQRYDKLQQSPHWGVIADDLTGACDCGGAFTRYGFTTSVYCDGRCSGKKANDVIVIPTYSRGIPENIAFTRVLKTAQQLVNRQVRGFYKKIDSTLKGNLRIEIEAALCGLPQTLAVIAPAFPEMGRRIINGELRVGEQREATGSHLPSLLTTDSRSSIETIDSRQVARGVPALLNTLQECIRRDVQFAVVDAVDDQDLVTISKVCHHLRDSILGVGSAGLAYCLARESAPTQPQTTSPQHTSNQHNNVLLFIGSTNPVTHHQLQNVLADGATATPAAELWQQQELEDALHHGQHLIVPIRWHGSQEQEYLRSLLATSASWKPAGVLFSGGDTAQLICELASVEKIALQREVTPGMPRGILCGGILDGIPVITKAGGFGDSRALQTAIHNLSQTS
ncbi:MAG: four-carbon acid sugar kinase family protein [Planctomycetota bacterium]|nr:four-carbon acid sugar kinase family protein [Planctomycetota bacterium]